MALPRITVIRTSLTCTASLRETVLQQRKDLEPLWDHKSAPESASCHKRLMMLQQRDGAAAPLSGLRVYLCACGTFCVNGAAASFGLFRVVVGFEMQNGKFFFSLRL